MTVIETPERVRAAPDVLDVARMPHVAVLDGFRAIAVGLVIVAHLGLYWIVPGGFGVTVFFFLSGFLITSLLRLEHANSGRIDFAGFYVRRVARIIPPLWITMIFATVAYLAGATILPFDWQGALADLTFLTNYVHVFSDHRGFPGMPLWSLAVEEHFYFIFPLIVMALLPRIGPHRLAALCGGACVVVLLFRVAHAAVGQAEANYYMTHTRIDSILFGCILALWQNPVLGPHPVWRPKPYQVGLAFAALLLMLVIRSPVMRQTIRYTVQGIALFVIFSAVLQSRDRVLLWIVNLKIVKLTALYSYSMYLVHPIIIFGFIAKFPDLSPWVRVPACVALTYGYCALMFEGVERPLAKLRQRLNRRNEDANPAV